MNNREQQMVNECCGNTWLTIFCSFLLSKSHVYLCVSRITPKCHLSSIQLRRIDWRTNWRMSILQSVTSIRTSYDSTRETSIYLINYISYLLSQKRSLHMHSVSSTILLNISSVWRMTAIFLKFTTSNETNTKYM